VITTNPLAPVNALARPRADDTLAESSISTEMRPAASRILSGAAARGLSARVAMTRSAMGTRFLHLANIFVLHCAKNQRERPSPYAADKVERSAMRRRDCEQRPTHIQVNHPAVELPENAQANESRECPFNRIGGNREPLFR